MCATEKDAYRPYWPIERGRSSRSSGTSKTASAQAHTMAFNRSDLGPNAVVLVDSTLQQAVRRVFIFHFGLVRLIGFVRLIDLIRWSSITHIFLRNKTTIDLRLFVCLAGGLTPALIDLRGSTVQIGRRALRGTGRTRSLTGIHEETARRVLPALETVFTKSVPVLYE